MSTAIPDAPTFDPPVRVDPNQKDQEGLLEGKFSRVWLGWFLAQNRALQDLQASLPVSTQAFSLISGPGPITFSVSVTMRRAGTLNIFANLEQAWVTAAPSWLIEVLVDGAVVNTSGTISNTWQNLLCMNVQKQVSAGTHNVTVRWTVGSANGILEYMVLNVFPVYTT